MEAELENLQKHTIERLQRADDAYTNDGMLLMTDMEYDALWMYAKEKWPNDPYFATVGSQVRGGKIDLPVPMPSLDQIQIGDFGHWIANNDLQRKTLVITKKLDGVSVLLQYNARGKFIKAYSRGDGIQGADITRHVQHLDFPKHINVGYVGSTLLRGEIMCSGSGFEMINQMSEEKGGRVYANPRNFVAGFLNASQSDPRFYKHITLFVYQAIGSEQNYNELYDSLHVAGFRLPIRNTMVNPSEDELAEVLQDIKTDRYDGFECDGLVVYVDDFATREQLDRDCQPGDNPKSAIKYKITGSDNQATSIVVGVEWDVSKDGYYKPRVRINPIKLLGTTVQYATGFNARFIVENGVVAGAVVTVTRSGDVIPFIQKVTGGSKELAQQQLPHDGKWTETRIDWIVDHTQEVSQEIQKRIDIQTLLDFFSTLEVANLKEGTITALYESGYKSIIDIIHMDEDDMIGLIGSNGGKIYKSLHEKLMDIEPWVLYGAHPAFGRGIGTRKFKALFDALGSNADSHKLTYDMIMSVEGFQEKTATKIVDGLSDFNDFLVDIYGKYKFRKLKTKGGAFDGQTIIMTGFRDATLASKIESEGGKIGSSVSKNTTLVIAADPREKSGKIKMAANLGIPVISRSDFVAQLAS